MPNVILLLAVLALDRASAAVPSEGVEALKQQLFNSYDPSTWPPRVQPDVGVQVEIGLNIHQIERIDIAAGILEMHAWLRLWWTDTRLSWSPANHSGIEFITASGHLPTLPGPTHNVWVPDVELYNGANSVYNAPHKDVTIGHDGSCFWSRPQQFRVLCAFEGLEQFPFDVMACKLRFGQWTLDDRFQNLTLRSQTPALMSENIPRVSWLEYEISDVNTNRVVESWSCCPGGWPLVEFTIHVERYTKYYDLKVLSINVLLTYLSFGVFFTHPKAINRQHFSSTMLLTIVTYDIFVDSMMPRARSAMWMEIFIYGSWLFVFLVCVANFVVLYLYWYADPTFLRSHTWVSQGLSLCFGRLYRFLTRAKAKAKATKVAPNAERAAPPPIITPDTPPPLLHHPSEDGSTTPDSSFRSARRGSILKARTCANLSGISRSSRNLSEQMTALDPEKDPVFAAKVRRVFRLLDSSRKGYLSQTNIELWEHHIGLRVPPKPVAPGEEVQWTIDEFAQMCNQALEAHGADQFEKLVQGISETYASTSVDREIYFHTLAVRVDVQSRWLFPMSYSFLILVLFWYRWTSTMPAPEPIPMLYTGT